MSKAKHLKAGSPTLVTVVEAAQAERAALSSEACSVWVSSDASVSTDALLMPSRWSLSRQASPRQFPELREACFGLPSRAGLRQTPPPEMLPHLQPGLNSRPQAILLAPVAEC